MATKMPVTRMGTLRVRVPTLDWSAVRCGAKTEFRTLVGSKKGLTPSAFPYLPTPAVAYCTRYGGRNSTTMVVVEKAWREPLGSPSAESLACEGFETFQDFKQYWLLRRAAEVPHGRRVEWSPLKEVNVIRLRLMTQEDVVWAGRYLLHRLYGEYMEEIQA